MDRTDDEDPDVQEDETFDMDGEFASAEEVRRVLEDVDPDLRFLFIQHYFDEVPIAEIAKYQGAHEGTIKTRLRKAKRKVKAAWTRYKARERHGEHRSNVVPIFGPTTFLEAGRQVPRLPDEVRARIWNNLQRICYGGGGGEGGGGGGPPAASDVGAVRPLTGALRGVFAVPARVVAAVVGAGLFGAGVLVGALWDPFHRPRMPPMDAAAARPALAATVVQPPVPASGAAETSEPPTEPPAELQGAPEASSAAPVSSATVEHTLMDHATRALKAGRTDLTLALLQEHAATFHGGGMLAQQREALWIATLVRAGRTSEARERFARFEAVYPGSPRLAGLRETLGTP